MSLDLIESNVKIEANLSPNDGKSWDHLRQYYGSFVMNSSLMFVCNVCEQTERYESDMREHLNDHLNGDTEDMEDLSDDNNAVNVELPIKGVIEWTPSIGTNRPIDGNSCEQIMTTNGGYDCASDARNGHSSDEQMNESLDMSDNSWQNWVEIQLIDGKEKLFCKWFGCQFGSHLRIQVKQHINKHLRQNNTPNNGILPQTESEFWQLLLNNESKPEIPTNSRQNFMFDPLAESTPKQHKPKAGSKPMSGTNMALNGMRELAMNGVRELAMNGMPDMAANGVTDMSIKKEVKTEASFESKTSQLIDVNLSQDNVVLSVKGYTSASKLKNHIRLEVIDGIKFYFCKYNDYCPFKSRRTQEIARHIHTTHIGFFLKCIQPNCDKVFRSRDSWVEHQKNHICNFGIYGYQKNVSGVCRNDYLLQYRERTILSNGQKGYRCIYPGCEYLTRHFTCVKRHIHNQHICPYRNNDEWKAQLNNYKQYTEQLADIPHIPIDYTMNDRNNDHMIDDKRKILPKPKPESKNISQNKNLRQNGENVRKTEKSKPIEENYRKTSQQMEYEVKPNLSNRSDTKTENNGFIEHKVFEGIDYYLCKYIDCKFVTKFTDKIYEHIMNHDLRSDTVVVNAMGGADRMAQKRMKESPLNRSVEICAQNNVKKSRSQMAMESNQNSSTESYIKMKNIEDEPNYFCRHNDCKYYSNSIEEVQTHIQSTHTVFKCSLPMCDKVCKTENLLFLHKRNHICGFGIKGMKSSGVCDLDNVRRYRGEIKVDNRSVYRCKYLDCKFGSDSKTTTLSHIHNKHICPNREQTNVLTKN